MSNHFKPLNQFEPQFKALQRGSTAETKSFKIVTISGTNRGSNYGTIFDAKTENSSNLWQRQVPYPWENRVSKKRRLEATCREGGGE